MTTFFIQNIIRLFIIIYLNRLIILTAAYLISTVCCCKIKWRRIIENSLNNKNRPEAIVAIIDL